MYFIRFLPPNENAERIFRPQVVERFEQPPERARSAPVAPSKRASGNIVYPNTVYSKSVSIADLLRAGKLVLNRPRLLHYRWNFLMLRSVNG